MQTRPIKGQQLVDILKIHYGLDIHSAVLLAGGADMNAVAYKADSESKSYFVKLKYDDHDDIGLSILRLLHDSGVKEIIFPIPTIDTTLFQQLEHFKIIVYPFIDAPNGFTQDLTIRQWKELGGVLRQIHDISVPELLQKQLRKETYQTKWRDIVRSFYSSIEPNHHDDTLRADFKLFFKQNMDTIKTLVDSSEALSKRIQSDVDNNVLCHSDIHAGNVMVVQESIYIIDWDEPMLAPKERDLMFIGGGVGNVWNKPEEIDYFYEGYGKTDVNKTILSYYRHERIIEDMAIYGQDLLSNTQDDQSRRESLGYFKVMFAPNDVIEIAFASSAFGS